MKGGDFFKEIVLFLGGVYGVLEAGTIILNTSKALTPWEAVDCLPWIRGERIVSRRWRKGQIRRFHRLRPPWQLLAHVQDVPVRRQ